MSDTSNGTAMAVRDERRALTTAGPNPFDGFELLTPRGSVTPPLRMESIGTISAGYRGQNGLPVISRDGTIHVTDDALMPATGLRQALSERKDKALTIAFGSNDVSAIIQQRLTTYSKSRLEAHGDAHQITRIHPSGAREQVLRATEPDKYAAWAATMKAQTFVFFHLARWTVDGRPEIYLPDGFVNYRLRTTSINSAAAIVGQLRFISEKTGGSFAGIPLDLFLTYREVADPKGEKRNVPIWTLVMRPPGELQLDTAGSMRAILKAGMEQAEALSLPAPEIMTADQLALEAPPVDDDGVIEGVVVNDDDVRILRGGGPIGNFDRFKTEYFLAAGKSSLRSEEGRHDFLMHWTGGKTGSLREFAQLYTSHDGEKLLEAVNARAILEREASDAPPAPRPQTVAPKGRGYADLFPDDDALLEAPKPKAQPISRKTVPTASTQVAVALTGGPTSVPPAADDDDYVPVDEEQYQADLLAELARDGQLP